LRVEESPRLSLSLAKYLTDPPICQYLPSPLRSRGEREESRYTEPRELTLSAATKSDTREEGRERARVILYLLACFTRVFTGSGTLS